MKQILPILLTVLTRTGLHAQSIGPATLSPTRVGAIIGGDEFEWSVGELARVSTFIGSGIIHPPRCTSTRTAIEAVEC